MVVRGVGGSEPIKPNKNIQSVKSEKELHSNKVKDEVSISEDAKLYLQKKQAEEIAMNVIKNLPNLREEAIERGKKFIESGEYKKDKVIESVAKKIGEEIIASVIVRKEDNS